MDFRWWFIKVTNTKIKPILPTLRENKRYISFNVTSEAEIDYKSVKEAINTTFANYVGTLGVSKAGIIFVDNSYNPNSR